MKKLILSTALLVAFTTLSMSFSVVPSQVNNGPIVPPTYADAWFVNVQGSIFAFPTLECATEYAAIFGGQLWGTGAVEPYQFSQCPMDF